MTIVEEEMERATAGGLAPDVVLSLTDRFVSETVEPFDLGDPASRLHQVALASIRRRLRSALDAAAAAATPGAAVAGTPVSQPSQPSLSRLSGVSPLVQNGARVRTAFEGCANEAHGKEEAVHGRLLQRALPPEETSAQASRMAIVGFWVSSLLCADASVDRPADSAFAAPPGDVTRLTVEQLSVAADSLLRVYGPAALSVARLLVELRGNIDEEQIVCACQCAVEIREIGKARSGDDPMSSLEALAGQALELMPDPIPGEEHDPTAVINSFLSVASPHVWLRHLEPGSVSLGLKVLSTAPDFRWDDCKATHSSAALLADLMIAVPTDAESGVTPEELAVIVLQSMSVSKFSGSVSPSELARRSVARKLASRATPRNDNLVRELRDAASEAQSKLGTPPKEPPVAPVAPAASSRSFVCAVAATAALSTVLVLTVGAIGLGVAFGYLSIDAGTPRTAAVVTPPSAMFQTFTSSVALAFLFVVSCIACWLAEHLGSRLTNYLLGVRLQANSKRRAGCPYNSTRQTSPSVYGQGLHYAIDLLGSSLSSPASLVTLPYAIVSVCLALYFLAGATLLQIHDTHDTGDWRSRSATFSSSGHGYQSLRSTVYSSCRCAMELATDLNLPGDLWYFLAVEIATEQLTPTFKFRKRWNPPILDTFWFCCSCLGKIALSVFRRTLSTVRPAFLQLFYAPVYSQPYVLTVALLWCLRRCVHTLSSHSRPTSVDPASPVPVAATAPEPLALRRVGPIIEPPRFLSPVATRRSSKKRTPPSLHRVSVDHDEPLSNVVFGRALLNRRASKRRSKRSRGLSAFAVAISLIMDSGCTFHIHTDADDLVNRRACSDRVTGVDEKVHRCT